MLGRITQLRTGNGDNGECLQKRKVPKNVYGCKCGAFKTLLNVVEHCQRATLKREGFLGVSPYLELVELLDTLKGLQTMKEYFVMRVDTAKKGNKNPA